MKRSLIFALVLTLTVGFVGSVFAGGGKGVNNAARQRGTGRRFEKLHEALDKLDLNADQHKAIDDALTSAETQLRDLRAQAKSSGDKQAARGKVKEIMQQTIQKIEQQLTPEQRTQLRAQVKQTRQEAREKKAEPAPSTQPQA